MTRTYTELIRIPTFEERFEYLKLNGRVGSDTFGFDRYMNQILYRSYKWRKLRDGLIVRDNGCDLAHEDHPLSGRIIIHHMNPITPEQVEKDDPEIYNPEFLICTANITHEAIHYGDSSLLPKPIIERRPGDTCPWRK